MVQETPNGEQDLLSALIPRYVLYHARKGPNFGLGMVQQLRHLRI